MKTFKNVKSIRLKMTFEGDGCVNYDSQSQKFFLLKNGLLKTDKNDADNFMFAKKNFYNSPDGEVSYLYKVSGDCLRHHIFVDQIPVQNPNLLAVKSMEYSTLSNWAWLMRGWFFADKNETIAKKSPLVVCDAEEVGTHRTDSLMEFHSVSSPKKEGNDTSIYNVENIGKITYVSNGAINLSELQFIPDDPVYGPNRVSLNLFDNGGLKNFYIASLAKQSPSMAGSDFGYYYKKGCYMQDEFAERGLLLTKEAVNTIIVNTLNGILNLQIFRRVSAFEICSLGIDVITDNGKETITVTKENVNDLFFEYSESYLPADEAKVVENARIFAEYEKAKKEKKDKEENEEKKSKSKKKEKTEEE